MKYMINTSGPSRAVFVKDAAFFENQGGTEEPWGESWVPIEALSLQHARFIAMRDHGGRKDGLFCPHCGAETHRGNCEPDWSYIELDSKSEVALNQEVLRARHKFPGNRFLLAALTEEVGELAQALLQNAGVERVRQEALQVACVAMRIYEEGDASFADIKPEETLP